MDLYAGTAPYFDKITRGGYYNYPQLYKDFSRLIHGKKVLEIGTGTGVLTKLLSKRFQITGIDISRPLLKIARHKLRNTNVRLLYKDILDFRSKELFDSVISNASVFVVIQTKEGNMIESYITKKSDIPKCLRNIYSHLRRGGRFILDFYPEHDPSERFYAFGEYRYEFKIIKKDGMRDFVKVDYIKKGNKTVAESRVHKIRIPLEEFRKIAFKIGFLSIKVMLKKYLVLEK